MKIVVFVKQVPDTTDVKLDPKTGNLQRDGVQSIMNEMDAHALETALQIKSKTGGTVAVVSMGPPQAEDVLKKAMAMGADGGYLLSDRAFGGADTLATAYVLSKACEKIGDCDLFIAGKSASDGETAQTGPIIAAYLGVPQISLADSLEVVDGWAVATRRTEKATEKVRAKLPALVTVTENINTPRYPKPLDIMKALKKTRTVWNHEDLGADPAKCGIPGSPSVTKHLFEPKHEAVDTVRFTGDVEEMAKQFVDMLAQQHLI